jgi:hypothetical protein
MINQLVCRGFLLRQLLFEDKQVALRPHRLYFPFSISPAWACGGRVPIPNQQQESDVPLEQQSIKKQVEEQEQDESGRNDSIDQETRVTRNPHQVLPSRSSSCGSRHRRGVRGGRSQESILGGAE